MEPTRIEQHGGTADELALLRAARRECPPDGARARALAAIAVAAGVTAIGVPAAATSSMLAAVGKWFVAGALVGAVGVGSVHVLSPSKPPPKASNVEPVAAPPARVEAPANATALAPKRDEVVTADDDQPQPLPRASSPAPRATTTSDVARPARLAEERALLERARASLAAGATGDAAQALARYAERFRAGALAEEASVLRIELALSRGDAALAVTLCDAYLASRSDGPHTARVRAMRARALGEK